jgi:GWxTD domain-containing protein
MMGRHIPSVLAAIILIVSPVILTAQETAPPGGELQQKFERAREMIKGSNFGAAKGLMDEVLASNPNSGEALFYKALATIGTTDKVRVAEKEVSLIFVESAKNGFHIPAGGWDNFPVDIRYYIEANWEFADDYIDQEDPQNYQVAINLLENIVEVDHEQHDASEHLGKLYVRTGQNREALDLFQRLLERNPDESEGIYTMGLGYFDIFNKEIAQSILSDLSSQGPEEMTSLMKLLMARAFFVLEDVRIASVYYSQCLDDLNEIAAREMYRDVMDIVVPKEKTEWNNARTLDQKRLFIRKFWKSRDPSPTTEFNERLVEHYRRLNYSKQHYTMKQTKGYDDRGIVYIKHGEPDEYADLVGNFGIRDNETWVYERRPENFVFHFVRRSSSYFIANSLTEAVIGSQFTQSFTMRDDPENPEQPITLEANDFSKNFRDLLWSRVEIDPIYMRLYNDRVDFDDPGYLEQEMMTTWQMMEADLVEPALTRGMESETYIPDMGSEPMDYYYYTADFMAMNANSNVSIFYGLPVASLEFKRDIIGVRVNYESTFAVFDQSWNEVDRVYNRRSYQLSQEPDLDNKGLLLVDKQTLNLPPGEYHYSVSVKDLGSENMGIYKGDLDVTHYQPNSFNVSQIVLASNIAPFDGEKRGKFTRGTYNVMPLPSRTFRREQAVFVYYEIYFLNKDDENKKNYHIDFTIEAENLDQNLVAKIFSPFGKLFNSDKDKGKITMTFQKEADPERIVQQEYVSIDISDSPAGEYNLNVIVTDVTTGEQITRKSQFYIVK